MGGELRPFLGIAGNGVAVQVNARRDHQPVVGDRRAIGHLNRFCVAIDVGCIAGHLGDAVTRLEIAPVLGDGIKGPEPAEIKIGEKAGGELFRSIDQGV